MATKAKPAVKEKRRNNEKRKEKSRDAARHRRSRETEIFTDLSQALPLSRDTAEQLDKASIIRLAIAFLRVRDMVQILPEIAPVKTTHDESVFLKALEGFIIVVSTDGDLVFLSENINEYLGITQIDLMGQNIYEYSHPCDHDEIKEILTAKTQDAISLPKSFFLRLKCTLTSKGRSVNLRSATYKVIHCTGHMIKKQEGKKSESKKDTKHNSTVDKCLVAIGQPIPHPSNIEIPLDKKTFLTKHSLDMKFTYADDKMLEVLGYEADDLVGKSVYQYHHALDSDSIITDFKSLFHKGQCETGQYRFLAKTGGFVWVVTQATLIHDKMQKPQSVVCVNYVISGVECKDEIYSAAQLLASSTALLREGCPAAATADAEEAPTPAETPTAVLKEALKEALKEKQPPAAVFADKPQVPVALVAPFFIDNSALANRPQSATSKIFAPRTEEMNTGFLTFTDEEGNTMLKEDPEDLTHLAPTAGDVCVPLEDNPFFSDVLDDLFLRETYGPLLAEDLHSLDSDCSKNSDPFISYRDDFDDSANSSPHLPIASKSSPCSVPSLNSPGESLPDDDNISTLMMQMDEDDPDLSMKAPYIPMNIGDDLPLLTSDDLMWGPSASEAKACKVPAGGSAAALKTPPDITTSSLAQLLSSNVNAKVKMTDQAGGSLVEPSKVLRMYGQKNSPYWSKASPNVQVSEKPTSNSASCGNSNSIGSSNGSNKRISTSSAYEDCRTKRTRGDGKDKLPTELLHQLMSNNHPRPKAKSKPGNNWVIGTPNGKSASQQPSDSVLMNLLEDEKKLLMLKNRMKPPDNSRQNTIRKNSFSLLDPEATTIPSLLDLTQQDFEVNAPVSNSLLQGQDLITALDITSEI